MTTINRTAHIDWIQGIMAVSDEADVAMKMSLLVSFMADEIVIESDRPRNEGKWYPASGYSAKGLRFAYNVEDGDCWFSAPGSFLACVPDTVKSLFFKHLASFQPRITRLDLAVDDYDRILTPGFLDGAAERGMVPRYARTGLHKSRRAGLCGETFTAGGRRSPKYYRVYDKYIESGGRINSIRWELELHGRLATAAFYSMRDSGWADSLLIEDIVMSNIDFRLPTPGRVAVDSRPLAGWWKAFIGASRRILMRASSPVQSVERSRRFLARQAATGLAILKRTSADFIGEVRRLAADGERRFARSHLAIIESWRREKDLRDIWRGMGWPLDELAPVLESA